MSRPKKDGRSISFFMDRATVERLQAYADAKGQTLTTAAERLINRAIDIETKREENAQEERAIFK